MHKPSRNIAILVLIMSLLPYVAKAGDVESKNQIDSSYDSEIHWDYKGEGRPENWGKIKGEFKTCRLGEYQSPIDIIPTISADLPNIYTNYKNVPLKIVNNGHTIQVNYPKGSKMVIGGVSYNLLQFHFHAKSENAIKGKAYDMEMHLVHSTDDGNLGVLGVMIKKGLHNKVIDKIWGHMPLKKSIEQTYFNTHFNVGELLPNNLSYYRFMGSLTTPPCTENVAWHVLKKPIQASETQINKFKELFPMNFRPIQPKNNRLIVSEIQLKNIMKEQNNDQ